MNGSTQAKRPDAPLGTLIFRAGLVPADQLEDALDEGVRTGRRLGEILLERGLIAEADLAQVIARQSGLPFVRLREDGVDPAAARLLSEQKARLHRALPIGFEDGAPVVAIADPTNESTLRELAAALGREPTLAVAPRSELVEAIARAYGSGPVSEVPLLEVVPPAPERLVHLSRSSFQVVVRLSGGERVEIAAGVDHRQAEAEARAFIRSLADREPGEWPLVAGRFLRPDAIVSVDLVERPPAPGAA